MISKSHQDILLMRWALCSLAGIILIVVLYSTGITPDWTLSVRTAMTQPPFLLPADAPAPSAGAGFLLCILLTLAGVYNLLLIRGILCQISILLGFLIILACFMPVMGLWGVFFNTIPLVISLAAAGLTAILWTLPGRESPPSSSNA